MSRPELVVAPVTCRKSGRNSPTEPIVTEDVPQAGEEGAIAEQAQRKDRLPARRSRNRNIPSAGRRAQADDLVEPQGYCGHRARSPADGGNSGDEPAPA
jgi:hypothetical protein